MNKKAQGLSTNAIILIVLGVIVLVVLVVGFLAGWDKIASWIKPSNNVKTIVDACSMACSTNSVYDYCNVTREVKGVDALKAQKLPCKDLVNKSIGVVACPNLC